MYAALIRLAFITFTAIVVASCAAGFGATAGIAGIRASSNNSFIRINSPQETNTDLNVELFTFKWRSGNRSRVQW